MKTDEAGGSGNQDSGHITRCSMFASQLPCDRHAFDFVIGLAFPRFQTSLCKQPHQATSWMLAPAIQFRAER